MDPARWVRARSILEGALALAPEERAPFVVYECAGDAELEREVSELLAEAQGTLGFEPPGAAEFLAALGDGEIGGHVGPYRIERLLGAGGMGLVYLAHRTGVDFEQRVALKLIKRGMDTEEVLQRFRRERAVLAGLQHPGIARLHDGGASEDGRPWLAMEYVEGQRIDEWCREGGLGPRAQIELFLAVCDAVQHAHQRLVIHRDLKPSNILVSADGAPKLLDFGIAKVLAPGAEEGALRTSTTERRLTPAYASPEQLRGEEVTTASDVYSLGVILYELLCGSRPFETGAPLIGAVPERPSTRAARAKDPTTASLRRVLRGDLDTILLTALSEETTRRYPTVAALSADLRRYLDGHPILARPASPLYVARKFERRNRVAVGAGALVVVAVGAGLVVAREGYVEAVEQRAVAEQREQDASRQARRAQAVLDMTFGMIRGAVPNAVREKDITLRALLEDFETGLALRRVDDPLIEASMRHVLGRTWRMLGQFDGAERHLARALEIVQAGSDAGLELELSIHIDRLILLQDRGQNERVLQEVDALIERAERGEGVVILHALLLQTRSDSLRFLDRRVEAEANLRECLALLLSEVEPDALQVIDTRSSLGLLLGERGEHAAAIVELRAALDLIRAAEPSGTPREAALLNNLGIMQTKLGAFADARASLERARELWLALRGPEHRELAPTLANLARLHLAQGEPHAAEPLLLRAVEIQRAAMAGPHPGIAAELGSLGLALVASGDPTGAEPYLRESLQMRRALFQGDHVDLAFALHNLGSVLRQRGSLDEAETLVGESIAMRERLSGAGHASLAAPLVTLALIQMDRGRTQEAVTTASEAVEILRDQPEIDRAALSKVLLSLGSMQLRAGLSEAMQTSLAEALEMQTELYGARHPDRANTLMLLGEAALDAGRLDQAAELLEESRALQLELLGRDHHSLGRTLGALSELAIASGDPVEAEPLRRECLRIYRRTWGDGHARTRSAARKLVKLLEDLGRSEEAAELQAELLPAAAASN